MTDDGFHEITALRTQLAEVSKERDAFKDALLAHASLVHKESPVSSWTKLEHPYGRVLIVTTRVDEDTVTASVVCINAT